MHTKIQKECKKINGLSLNSGIIYPIKSHRVGGIFMHQYPLRVEKYLFEKIE